MKFSLQTIHIENFRAVKSSLSLNFTVFTPGLYFIQGINDAEPRLGSNGAGKSSILVDSFYWALTGKIARSQRPGEIVENWFNSKKVTKVVLTFSLDDNVHIIERTRNPNNLTLDGDRVEQPVIDALLPLTDASLRRSILIDQFGEMFLSLRPEAQSRIFSETLDLEKWIDASDRAGKEVSENEKALIIANAKISNGEDNLVELNDQYELASDNRDSYEEAYRQRLAEVRLRRAEAGAQAHESREALDTAREAFSAIGGEEDKALLQQKRVLLTNENRNIGRLESKHNTDKIQLGRLEKQLEPYKNTTTCPECGQEVTPEHIKAKEKELLLQITEKHLDIESTFEALKDARKNASQITDDITLLEENLTEYDRLQTVVAVAAEKSLRDDREMHRIDGELNKLKEEVNPYTEQCNRLEKRRQEVAAEIKDYKETLAMLNVELEVFKFWQKGFKEIRLEQIDNTLLELEMATNHHAEELGLDGWEIGFATDRELKSGKISHSFSVFLYPPQQKNAIAWESYSGGESQRWQLATTFGLAEVLLARSGIDTDFEVLDEPTTHLSPEGIDDLLACLTNRAQELNRRIFLIDHHSLDRGAFDGVITVRKTADAGVRVESGISGFVTKRERVRL